LPKLLEQTGPRGNGGSSEIRSKLISVQNLPGEEETREKPDVILNISRVRRLYRKKLFFFLLNVTVFVEIFLREL